MIPVEELLRFIHKTSSQKRGGTIVSKQETIRKHFFNTFVGLPSSQVALFSSRLSIKRDGIRAA